MEFNEILTLVGSYAFPIVFCILLWWKSWKDSEAHAAEMEKVTDALHNNTIALNKLITLIDGRANNGTAGV